jgi:hypothetical protein
MVFIYCLDQRPPRELQRGLGQAACLRKYHLIYGASGEDKDYPLTPGIGDRCGGSGLSALCMASGMPGDAGRPDRSA